MPEMSVTEALKARKSIRAFTDQPVSQKLVTDILDRARWSPSGGNLQPWKVIAVTGQAQAEIISLAQKVLFANIKGEADEYPIYPEDLNETYMARRRKVATDMYEILGIGRENKAERMSWMGKNFQFFGAPVGLFFVIDRTMGRGQWAHLGMFMQSIALVAVEMGLATCMQEAWAMVRKSLHAHFSLRQEEVVYCGLALGWPDAEAKINHLQTDRADVGDFTKFEGF